MLRGESAAEQDIEAEEKRIQNFIISTAAYCVASCNGAWRQHNDNLVITSSAHFFLDFGHILATSRVSTEEEERAPSFSRTLKEVMDEINSTIRRVVLRHIQSPARQRIIWYHCAPSNPMRALIANRKGRNVDI